MYYGPPAVVVGQPQQSNGLGVAGFVISLIGLLLCGGFLCPLGLLLSFIAMFKEPRGMAVAGFLIGLLGTGVSILIVVLYVFAAVAQANQGQW